MSTAIPTPPVNYSGNSNAAKANAEAAQEPKEERKKMPKIEGIEVAKVKPSLGSRFAATFGGQNLKTVGKTVALEILLPGARDIVFDIVKESASRMLYGDSVRRTSAGTIGQQIVGSTASRIRTTNYSTMSASPVITQQQQGALLTPQQKAKFDFSTLVFADQAMALEVLTKLDDAINEFGIVTVADFYDAINEQGNGFTDQTHGWNRQAFTGAEVQRARGGGFVLNLPTPREIG